jgi:heme exporter protein A
MTRLEVRQISKHFGHVQALSNINFECNPSTALVLLGPNGAGKTTLLRILALLMRPSSGNVSYNGKIPSSETKKNIGFCGHHTYLYGDLTVLENLTFFSKLYAIEDPEVKTKEVLKEFALDLLSHHVIRTLSRGLQQRVNLARTFLHNPSTLLLDEPFAHLDQKNSIFLLEKLRKFTTSGGALVLTTHQLELGEVLKNDWMILKEGQLVFKGTSDTKPGEIAQIYQKLTI